MAGFAKARAGGLTNRLAAMTVLMAGLLAAPAVSATEYRSREAKAITAWVDAMAERVGRDGLVRTLKGTRVGDWHRPELGLYIFVFETNGTLRAHPNARMIGHDIRPTQGARGRPYVNEIIQALDESGDAVWVGYDGWDPKTKRVRAKRTYARRIGLLILACGYFLDET
ncbi:MAG: cache domain-containing protein [Magnetovibrio sp.]|nr:cache domain-containing protein [Magnetovibrio sp.]